MKKYLLLFVVFLLSAIFLIDKPTSADASSKIVEDDASSEKVFKQLDDFPLIKDSSAFISDLKQVYNVHKERISNEEQINSFIKFNINGSDDDYYLIEYDYLDGSGASFPWKYQLILSSDGKLIKKLRAERFEFVEIFPDQNPFLLTVVRSSHGNGGHNFYKISADTLEDVYDQSVQTFDMHHWMSVYEPYELNIKYQDVDSDGFKDIIFYGKIVFLQAKSKKGIWYDSYMVAGEIMLYSINNPWKKVPIEYIFLFDPESGHFKAKEEYDRGHEQYAE